MAMSERPRWLQPWIPPVVVGAVVSLGVWGFARHTPSSSAIERFYRTLQLFVLETGDLSGRLPWQLEVARLAAPSLTVASAALALAAISRNRLDLWRAHRYRGHVVVCGLGSRGTSSALALAQAGHEVVGIDIDANCTGTGACRDVGIPVIFGDARDPAVLVRAGVPAAAHLVTLTPALAFGGEVALAAVGLVDDRDDPPLVIHLEIDRPELAALLRALQLGNHRRCGWRLEELDLNGVGARSMLDTQPPWESTSGPAQVLVFGATPLGNAVERELRRRWRRSDGVEGALTVTALEYEGMRTCLDGALDLGAPPVTVAYICLADEAASLAASLGILSVLPDVPVLVRLETSRALAEVLQQDAPGLRVMSMDQGVFTPEVLLEGTIERIARALHDSYRRTAVRGNPSAEPWERLPEQLRSSNRAQAGCIADKLRLTGRVLVPDDGLPVEMFTDEEVELLGRVEHDRWTNERSAAGWTSGPRDTAGMTTPYLVPWEDLDEDVREIDRQFVRALPDILADAGLSLRRRPPRLRPQL